MIHISNLELLFNHSLNDSKLESVSTIPIPKKIHTIGSHAIPISLKKETLPIPNVDCPGPDKSAHDERYLCIMSILKTHL